MFSNIDENQLIDIVASVNNSLQEDFQVDALDEEADDFMETYVAVNVDLKVRESQKIKSRQARNQAKTAVDHI